LCDIIIIVGDRVKKYREERKKKNKILGFTLIELLAVIVILAIILLVAVPTIIDVIDKAKNKTYENQIEIVEDAARLYMETNNVAQNSLNANGTYEVTMQELVDNQRLSELPIDPRDGSTFSGDVIVLVTLKPNGTATYVFQDPTAIIDGDEDGVSDLVEIAYGSDPGYGVDTDGDTLYDDYEIIILGTSPSLADTDYDGVNDDVDDDPLVYTDSNPGTLELHSSGYYLIGSKEDLVQWNKDLNNLPGDSGTYELNDNYYLVADVDMTGMDTDSNSANGNWNPIGTSTSNDFYGIFDGLGHTISNIEVISTVNYAGFFGYINDNNAKIHNLILDNITINSTVDYAAALVGSGTYVEVNNIQITNADIEGHNYVGGIAGNNQRGDIKNVKVQGDMTGNMYVAGIAGYQAFSNIEGVIANVNITADSVAGGLVGWFRSVGENMNNLYGAVVGGSITSNSNLNRCVYYLQYSPKVRTLSLNSVTLNGSTVTSTSITSKNGKDMETANLDKLNIYEYIGFDTYIGGDNDGDGYYWDYDRTIKKTSDEPIVFNLSGTGTEVDPYLIDDVVDLKQATQKLDKYYKLTSNIDYDNANYYMLGTGMVKFSGGFDGNGHTISDVTINEPSMNYVGLIGYIDNETTEIKDFNFEDITIYGDNYVGIIGVSKQNNVKDITGNNITIDASGDSVGGLIGYANTVEVNNIQMANVDVEGHNYVGGVVGNNQRGNVKNVKIKGSVTGNSYIAGGVGYQAYSNIDGLVTKVDVTASSIAGGLVGWFVSLGTNMNYIHGASLDGSVTSNSNLYRCMYYAQNSPTLKLLGLNTNLINGSTVSSTSITSKNGKNISSAESTTLTTYNQINFDIGSDTDSDGYYWDIVNGEISVVKSN